MDERTEALKSYLKGDLGIKPRDMEPYVQAFSHRSFIHEQGRGVHESNERLEFLGDSVLGLALTDHLMRRYPTSEEGDLSKMKAQLGSRQTLGVVAQRLNYAPHLRMGRGEAHSGSHNLPSLLSNTFEALVGAIYLDLGFEEAAKFVIRTLEPEFGQDLVAQDFKSTMQEFAQRRFHSSPHYQVLRAVGPEHKKMVQVVMRLNGKVYGRGQGHTKKDAEQDAARHALHRFGHKPEAGPKPVAVEALPEPLSAPRRGFWALLFGRRAES